MADPNLDLERRGEAFEHIEYVADQGAEPDYGVALAAARAAAGKQQ